MNCPGCDTELPDCAVECYNCGRKVNGSSHGSESTKQTEDKEYEVPYIPIIIVAIILLFTCVLIFSPSSTPPAGSDGNNTAQSVTNNISDPFGRFERYYKYNFNNTYMEAEIGENTYYIYNKNEHKQKIEFEYKLAFIDSIISNNSKEKVILIQNDTYNYRYFPTRKFAVKSIVPDEITDLQINYAIIEKKVQANIAFELTHKNDNTIRRIYFFDIPTAYLKQIQINRPQFQQLIIINQVKSYEVSDDEVKMPENVKIITESEFGNNEKMKEFVKEVGLLLIIKVMQDIL